MKPDPWFDAFLDAFFSYHLGGGEAERDRYFALSDVLKDEHIDRFLLHAGGTKMVLPLPKLTVL